MDLHGEINMQTTQPIAIEINRTITDKDRVEWWLRQTRCSIEYVDYCIKREKAVEGSI